MKPGTKHVSVVDDDSSVRRALSRLLWSMGYRVDSFVSAESFLRFLRHGTTSCLVLDMELPGLSGLQLQRQMLESGHSIPVVLITGQDIQEFPEVTPESGLVAFLIKPFDDDALLRAVRAGTGGRVGPLSIHSLAAGGKRLEYT